MCRHLCTCTGIYSRASACVSVVARGQHPVFLPYSLRQGLSPNSEPTNLARLANRPQGPSHLCFSRIGMHAHSHIRPFPQVLGYKLRSSSCTISTLLTNLSPQAPTHSPRKTCLLIHSSFTHSPFVSISHSNADKVC